MDRSGSSKPVVRTYEQIVDSQDLRAVITDALSATRVDEDALRRGVWTYVGTERHAGTSPGHVIIALTELVEGTKFASDDARQTYKRKVILWCVEACFGHLGGDVVPGHGSSLSDSESLTFSQ